MLIFVRSQIIQRNTLCHVHISLLMVSVKILCPSLLALVPPKRSHGTLCKEKRELMVGLILSRKKESRL